MYVFCSGSDSERMLIPIALQYRKAPEYPFPAASQDVEDVVQWVTAQSDERTKAFDTRKLSLGGFSAGASLTLSLSARMGRRSAEKQEKHPICACAALYPPAVFQLNGGKSRPAPVPASREQLRSKVPYGMPLPQTVMDIFQRAYILPAVGSEDPDMSPYFHDAAHFPDVTYVTCGDGDILYSDGFDLVEKIKKEGRPGQVAEHQTIKGAMHAFDKRTFGTNERSEEMRREAYDFLFEAIRKGHANVDKHQEAAPA